MNPPSASINYGPSKDFAVHRVASAANAPGLENLAELDKPPDVGAWIFALPIRIAGGSGGPLRIVALIPEYSLALLSEVPRERQGRVLRFEARH